MAQPMTVKLVVVGESSVGKTALALRYCSDEFNETTQATIGTDLFVKKVFVEAAQALGRMTTAQKSDDTTRAAYLYRRCLTHPPDAEDLAMLMQFYRTQKERFEKKELDAAAIAGPGEDDINDRAAWTTVARAILNLDETITKN